MKVKDVIGMYFSPTGTTRKIIEEMSQNIKYDAKKVDILKDGELNYILDSNDLLIIGVPVFGGRVPEIIIEKLKYIKGKDTLAIPIVVYGKRAYEDSLLELKNILVSKGFKVIAAATFIGQHSIVNSIATGRPNDSDLNILEEFAKKIVNKIDEIKDISKEVDITVPGNNVYREFKGIPFKPHTTSKCEKCGICAIECPTEAIPKEDPKKTYKDKCISCMHCVHICPQSARKLGVIELMLAKTMLTKECKENKEPELFLS